MPIPAVIFEDFSVRVLDQTLLPQTFTYIELITLEDSFQAIKTLKVRGAPLIGIVAAYSLATYAHSIKEKITKFSELMDSAFGYLKSCRPTAVNLAWAIDRMNSVCKINSGSDPDTITELLKREAIDIHEEDIESCRKIGLNGAEILPDPVNLLTHCNAGSLATGGWGTALGVVYAAREKGINIHVYVDETRPLGQGARLTLWELMKNNIPCTLITDSMAASLMSAGKVDVVVFGADRIARNGDVANKIGSYGLAVQANFHNIPCYCAAPLSTFDAKINHGNDIPIEQRDPQEILQFYKYDSTLSGIIQVYNPAFDITPAKYFTGIITESGILKKPLEKSITKLL